MITCYRFDYKTLFSWLLRFRMLFYKCHRLILTSRGMRLRVQYFNTSVYYVLVKLFTVSMYLWNYQLVSTLCEVKTLVSITIERRLSLCHNALWMMKCYSKKTLYTKCGKGCFSNWLIFFQNVFTCMSLKDMCTQIYVSIYCTKEQNVSINKTNTFVCVFVNKYIRLSGTHWHCPVRLRSYTIWKSIVI